MLFLLRHRLEDWCRRPLGRALGLALLLLVALGGTRGLEIHAHADGGAANGALSDAGDGDERETVPPDGGLEVHAHVVAAADSLIPGLHAVTVPPFHTSGLLTALKPLPAALFFRAPPHRPPIA